MRWQWVLAPLLAFTAFLWFCALGPSFQNLARALFYTLQFIVLNKDVHDGGLTNAPSLLVFGLTVAQFVIPFVASVAFFGEAATYFAWRVHYKFNVELH